jgi:hypothetical protein
VVRHQASDNADAVEKKEKVEGVGVGEAADVSAV